MNYVYSISFPSYENNKIPFAKEKYYLDGVICKVQLLGYFTDVVVSGRQVSEIFVSDCYQV
jgi:hypothetical protein